MSAAATTTEARQHQAALLLAHGLTTVNVAAQVGCSRRSLWQWRKHSRNFQAEFERAKRAVRRDIHRQMRPLTQAVMLTAAEAMRNGSKAHRRRWAWRVIEQLAESQPENIRAMVQEALAELQQAERDKLMKR